jgi:hypothetical protein
MEICNFLTHSLLALLKSLHCFLTSVPAPLLFFLQLVKPYLPADGHLNGNVLKPLQHLQLFMICMCCCVSTVFHVPIAQICCLLRYDVTEGQTAECANSTWRDEYVR